MRESYGRHGFCTQESSIALLNADSVELIVGEESLLQKGIHLGLPELLHFAEEGAHKA